MSSPTQAREDRAHAAVEGEAQRGQLWKERRRSEFNRVEGQEVTDA